MKNFVPFGTGNSRLMKSSIPAGTTWEQALAMLNAGTFPYDTGQLNAAGISQQGDPLNKNTLLKDATAQKYGGDDTMVPDDVLDALSKSVELHEAKVHDKVKWTDWESSEISNSIDSNMLFQNVNGRLIWLTYSAFGYSDDGVLYSTPGAYSTSPQSTLQPGNLCYNPDTGTIVAIGSNSGYSSAKFLSADGGKTFTVRVANGSYGTRGNGKYTAYGNGKYISVGGDWDVSWTYCTKFTEDSEDWSSRSGMKASDGKESTFGTHWLSGIAFGAGKFVCIASGDNSQYDNDRSKFTCYSTDGELWTIGEMPRTEHWGNIVYGNGMFLAVSGNRDFESVPYIAYSTDGVNWTDGGQLNSYSKYIYGVSFVDGVFYVIQEGNKIYTSTDCVNWEEHTFPQADKTQYGIAAINGRVCTYGYGISGSNTNFWSTADTYTSVYQLQDVKKKDISEAVYSAIASLIPTPESLRLITGTTTVGAEYNFGSNMNINCVLPVENAKAIIVLGPGNSSNKSLQVMFAVPGYGCAFYFYSNNTISHGIGNGISGKTAQFAGSMNNVNTGTAYYMCWY